MFRVYGRGFMGPRSSSTKSCCHVAPEPLGEALLPQARNHQPSPVSHQPSLAAAEKKLAELVTMVQNGEMETEFEDDGDEATFDWQVDDNKDKDKDEKEKEGSK